MPLNTKFILTADIHLKLWSDKEYTDTGLPVKLMEILGTIKQMCEYAVEQGIDTIVIAGDLNDTKGIVSVRAFLLFGQLVKEYEDKITFYILHGNHDATTGRVIEEESAIQLLSQHSNVILIMEPLREDSVLFVPHSKNVQDVIAEELERGLDGPIPITTLISHFGLNEGCLSNGISIKSSISLRDLTPFKKVYLGHYHKPQHLTEGDTSLYYAGSPIAIRRDETGEEKRFLVIDNENLTEESVPTTGWRQFVELVIDEDTNLEEFALALNRAKEAGHHIVVKKNVEAIPIEVASMVEASAQLVDIYEAEEEMRGITSGMSIKEQMEKLLEIEGVLEEEREEYMSVGMAAIAEEEQDDG